MPKQITLGEFNKVLKDVGALWRPPEKLEWFLAKDKRKMYHLQCQCGVWKWVRWRQIQQGSSLGCRRCRTGLLKHGKSRHPIYCTWCDLKKRGKETTWKTFEEFEKWAIKYWAKGFRLHRIDKTKPYSPENCDYVLIRKKKSEALPVGIKQLPTLPIGQIAS